MTSSINSNCSDWEVENDDEYSYEYVCSDDEAEKVTVGRFEGESDDSDDEDDNIDGIERECKKQRLENDDDTVLSCGDDHFAGLSADAINIILVFLNRRERMEFRLSRQLKEVVEEGRKYRCKIECKPYKSGEEIERICSILPPGRLEYLSIVTSKMLKVDEKDKVADEYSFDCRMSEYHYPSSADECARVREQYLRSLCKHKRVKHLTMERLAMNRPEWMPNNFLSGLNGLVSLHLTDCTRLSCNLRSLASLESLRLIRSDVRLDLKDLSGLCKLNTLAMSGSKKNVTGELRHLRDLPLKEMSLSHSCYVRGSLSDLAGLRESLQNIALKDCNLIQGSLTDLAALRETLQEVTFNECTALDGSLAHLSNFHCLRKLSLSSSLSPGTLRSRLPSVAGQFEGSLTDLLPLSDSLEELTLSNCARIGGSLLDLTNYSCLRKLSLSFSYARSDIEGSRHIEGSLIDLSNLSDKLEDLTLNNCGSIDGSLLDLANFSRLYKLNLSSSQFVGDVRDIHANQFPSLGEINVKSCSQIVGSFGVATVDEAHNIMLAWRNLGQGRSFNPDGVTLELHRGNAIVQLEPLVRHRRSEDRYSVPHRGPHCVSVDERNRAKTPPFKVTLRKVGSRWGYYWTNESVGHCKINWLDQEPSSSDEAHEEYHDALEKFQAKYEENPFNLFKCLNRPPPTLDEYKALLDSPEGQRISSLILSTAESVIFRDVQI